MDNSTADLLFSLVRESLSGVPSDRSAFMHLDEERWRALYRLAARQGVLAIAYDALSAFPSDLLPPRNLKIQWALSCESIENRYNSHYRAAAELTAIWSRESIRTTALKGFALSKYYPVPQHRECGDFDCFLCGDFERGNIVAEKAGARIDEYSYKHTHVFYKNLMVENHRFCIGIRGSREAKNLEAHLERLLLNSEAAEYVPGTDIIIPSADFTALFLTYHSLMHFLTEGIKLRHICDWGCLVAAEQHNIHWNEFYKACDKYRLRKFADAVTYIAVKYLGLQLTNPKITYDGRYADKILHSVLWEEDSINDRGKGKGWERVQLLRNVSKYRWRYRELYDTTYIARLCELACGFVFDRKPKIN